jgi:hypothetical protein
MGKYLKEKEGSTLLMVIITIAVLAILGLALISMSVMNVNMKYNDYRSKRSLYFAEAGIDEAYAIVGDTVDEAMLTATQETEIRVQDLINVTSSGVYNANGTLSDAALQTASNDIFIEEFKQAFNDKTGEIASRFNDIANTKIDNTITDADYDIAITYDVTNFDQFDLSVTSSGFYVINDFTATYTYKDYTKKTVTTDIVVQQPSFTYALEAVENIISVDVNPLWLKALVSNSGDITFKSGTTNIEGDVYALGTKPALVENYKNADEFGGIVATGGTTTIVGDVITDSYVQTDGSSGARLNIDYGHVYCDSLTVQKTANYTTVDIDNSNVYTSDDIELNGANSSISIDGSYYGYMSGNGFITSGDAHYNSSCILINSALYPSTDGSKLSITGSTAPIDYNEGSAANKNGIFIAGTSYVNADGTDYYGDTKTWPYQTGESLSVKKNYYAYAYPLTGTVDTFDYSNVEFSSPSGSSISFAMGYNDGVNTPVLLTQAQKVDYFMKFYVDVYSAGYATNYLNIGTPDSIDVNISAFQYILGSAIATNGSTNTIVDKTINSNTVTDYEEIKDQIEVDNAYYLVLGANNSELDNEVTAYAVKHDTTLKAELQQTPDLLSYYTTSTTAGGITNYVAYNNYDYVLNTAQEATQVVYISEVENETGVFTIGAGSSDVNTSYNGGRVQGIIVYNGDVEISGSVDFVGVIIAKGDITIQGSGTKNFYSFDDDHTTYTDVEKFIIRLIRSTDGLEIFFNSANLPNDDGVNDTAWFVENVEVKTSDDSNNNQNRFNELVYYDNWHIE